MNPDHLTCIVNQGYIYNKTMVLNKTKLKVNFLGYFPVNSDRNERIPHITSDFMHHFLDNNTLKVPL